MYQAMKRHSLLVILPRLIAALVLAVLLLAATTGNIVRILAGPQDLLALGGSVQAGDYVKVDISQLMSAYATLDNSSKTVKSYYVLKIGDQTYMSLHAGNHYSSQFSRAADQAYDYYRNNSGVLNPMGTVSGEVETLGDDWLKMLNEWLTGSSVEGFTDVENPTGTVLALNLEVDHVGGLSVLWNWVLFLLGLACLVWLGIELALVASGWYHRQVRALLGSDAAAAQEWQQAESFGNARVGKDYIWYSKGPVHHVFSFGSVVWVYKQFDPHVLGKYKWPVSIFTNQREYHELCVKEDAQREQMIHILHAHGGRFVTGYSQDNYDQFCNDFSAFCARAAAGDPDAGSPLIKLPD